MSVELGLGLIVTGAFLGIVFGLPLAYVFALGGVGFFLLRGTADPHVLMPSALKLMQSFTFLALPMYILLGKLMEAGVHSRRLIEWLTALFGAGKSALGTVGVVFCTFFGAVAGAATSAIAALGTVLIPRAVEYGYDREYLTGLVACSALISSLIPPSMNQIVYGLSSQLCIATCFLATAVPGIITTVFYVAINFVLTRRITAPGPTGRRGRRILYSTKRATTTLLLPLIVLGGIYGGIFTPTEAAAVAVVWVIFDGFVFHREFMVNFRGGLLEAGKIVGVIGALIFFLFTMSQAMVWMDVPEMLQSVVLATVSSKVTFLLLVNVLLLIMGMIMVDTACIIIASVLFLPIAVQFGVDPYHFGAILGVNMGIGMFTPPVAVGLYFGASIGDVPVKLWPPNRYVKTVFIYMLFGHLPALILVTCIPEISLFLPNLWRGM